MNNITTKQTLFYTILLYGILNHVNIIFGMLPDNTDQLKNTIMRIISNPKTDDKSNSITIWTTDGNPELYSLKKRMNNEGKLPLLTKNITSSEIKSNMNLNDFKNSNLLFIISYYIKNNRDVVLSYTPNENTSYYFKIISSQSQEELKTICSDSMSRLHNMSHLHNEKHSL